MHLWFFFTFIEKFIFLALFKANKTYENLLSYFGETEAAAYKIKTIEEVTQDERGLKMLIEDGNYSEALNLTTRLLAMYGQGSGQMGYPSKHTKHSLQVMFLIITFSICFIQSLIF